MLSLDDAEIVHRARSAKNADRFVRLYDRGDIGPYGGDDSRADQALCSLLTFWTQDADQIDRIFRQSALYRDKWERAKYRDGTIKKALQRSEVYEPTRAPVPSPVPAVPVGDPCAPVRDELAELRAENARLRAELAQVKRDLSAVIKVIGNPNLGGDAAGKALVLAATYVQAQRARVHSEDGYYRVTASKVADNREWVEAENGERLSVPVPAQVSPRTVTKYMAIAQERGLIPAEKRTVRVPKGEGDFPVEVWHWKAAPTLADQLAPLTGGTVYDEDNPRPVRGGDPKQRRLAPIPGCPECGNHQVACTSCAAIFDAPAVMDLGTGETLTEQEAEQVLEERQHSVPTRVRPTPTVVVSNGVTSLQSGSAGDAWPTVPAMLTPRQRCAFQSLETLDHDSGDASPPESGSPLTLFPLDDLAPPGQSHHFGADWGVI